MKVSCTVEYTEIENDEGLMVDSVEVTCSRCEHSTESFGTCQNSINRCLALLREECPEEESNFYVTEEADD